MRLLVSLRTILCSNTNNGESLETYSDVQADVAQAIEADKI